MASPKSYWPISLLPALGKALENLIIQDIETETGINDFRQQHGFVPGRSTITALKEMNAWVDESTCRHVFGVFLDITGTFDNVGWRPVLSRLEEMGASLRSISMICNYLTNRTVCYELENRAYVKQLQRGCSQSSQPGPTLWKVAMSALGKMKLDHTASLIL